MIESIEIQEKTQSQESNTFSANQFINQQQEILLQRAMKRSLQANVKHFNPEDGLPIKFRRMIINLKMKKSKQTCTICLQPFEQGQIIKKFPCKHILHRNCAKQWLKGKKNCPVCRLDLEEYFRKQIQKKPENDQELQEKAIK